MPSFNHHPINRCRLMQTSYHWLAFVALNKKDASFQLPSSSLHFRAPTGIIEIGRSVMPGPTSHRPSAVGLCSAATKGSRLDSLFWPTMCTGGASNAASGHSCGGNGADAIGVRCRAHGPTSCGVGSARGVAAPSRDLGAGPTRSPEKGCCYCAMVESVRCVRISCPTPSPRARVPRRLSDSVLLLCKSLSAEQSHSFSSISSLVSISVYSGGSTNVRLSNLEMQIVE